MRAFQAQPTPLGVEIFYISEDDGNDRNEVIGYEDAVNRLDSGEYDSCPDEGMKIHAAVTDGMRAGHFAYSLRHCVILWRWLTAELFFREMSGENGEIVTPYRNGSVMHVAIYEGSAMSITISRQSVRTDLAVNIEWPMAERYGSEEGGRNAMVRYCMMVDRVRGRLTPLGRDIMAGIHEARIDEITGRVLPTTHVMH
ncbi:hypothetical protein K5Z09_003347 [Escherichia coli]|nr:hypothetical protein [Escherichia coli]EHR8678962.1 hypothetical protein [Escherichia coli]EHR8983589.1 hypothetical protein [Escherichia coli]EHR9095973.1 hypothetical protein [Escherichia coli]EHR9216036.1 hypothetical protein [Escherichia coli]